MVRTAMIGWLMVSLAGCSAAAEDEQAPASAAPKREPRGLGIFGHTFELGPSMVAPGEWLDGVEVCTNDGELCTSAERGTYFLEGARPHSRFDLGFTKPGYVRSFVQVEVNKFDGFAEAGLLPVSAAQAFAEAAGAPALGETGGVLVEMMEQGYGVLEALSGASFAVLGSDRARSVYAGEHEMANAALTKTSPAGWGAALGITPGTIEVEARYDAGGRRCGVWSNEVSDLVNPAKFEVRAGQLTVVTMLCLNAGKQQQ